MNARLLPLLVPLVLGLTAALTPPPVQAQPSAVGPGDRVRVTTAGAVFVGRLVRSGPDTLVVATDGGPVAVPSSVVDRIEVSRRREGNAAAGAGLGLLAGGLLGGLAGSATTPARDPDCYGFGCNTGSSGFAAVGGALLGGLAGLVAGVVVGGVATDQWERAPKPVAVGLGRLPLGTLGRAPTVIVRVALR